MKITTRENHYFGTITIEDNNLKIEEDYNQFEFMDFINVGLSLFKFGKNIDDADFLIHLIKETTLSSSEQEKFNEFINNYARK